jgi:hypothetical protein
VFVSTLLFKETKVLVKTDFRGIINWNYFSVALPYQLQSKKVLVHYDRKKVLRYRRNVVLFRVTVRFDVARNDAGIGRRKRRKRQRRGVDVTKRASSSLTARQNKLECLSLASLFGLGRCFLQVLLAGIILG